jgi:hypothetical protein
MLLLLLVRGGAVVVVAMAIAIAPKACLPVPFLHLNTTLSLFGGVVLAAGEITGVRDRVGLSLVLGVVVLMSVLLFLVAAVAAVAVVVITGVCLLGVVAAMAIAVVITTIGSIVQPMCLLKLLALHWCSIKVSLAVRWGQSVCSTGTTHRRISIHSKTNAHLPTMPAY